VLIGELKIVDTLGDLPNIIWEACNENQARNRFENAVNNYTTRYETQTKGFGRHLTMPRDLPSHWDVAGSRDSETPVQVHANLLGNYTTSYGATVAQYKRSPPKPLISDNDCCDTEVSADFQRQKGWAALTAGTHIDFFFSYMSDPAVLNNGRTSPIDGQFYNTAQDWFDPRTAAQVAATAQGTRFVAPGSGDWTLYIKSE
jgi:hypothetical protein